MRIISENGWGWLLEHDQNPILIPRRMPFPVSSQVQIKPDLVVVIKSTDFAVIVDEEVQIILDGTDLAKEIQEFMVNALINGHSRR